MMFRATKCVSGTMGSEMRCPAHVTTGWRIWLTWRISCVYDGQCCENKIHVYKIMNNWWLTTHLNIASYKVEF